MRRLVFTPVLLLCLHCEGIVVTARVHPGESNSSWMCKGFLDFITSDDPDAEILRENYVFKIVPMLNPDGVIVGNYRTSFSGVDLNRVYKRSIAELFPTVFHIKSMMKRLAEDREIVLYVDLHGRYIYTLAGLITLQPIVGK